MYLFFDCETTGLPRNWHAPPTDLDNWPRVVQLAWRHYDEQEQHLAGRSAIVRPQGFTIPAAASAIHGITTERAIAEGVELTTLLGEFAAAIDQSRVLVAHNMNFDENVVGAEFLRTRLASCLLERTRFCTMTSTTELCALPGRYGFKWPTLSELHQRLFGGAPTGLHDADTDVDACARCFFELKRRNLVELPAG